MKKTVISLCLIGAIGFLGSTDVTAQRDSRNDKNVITVINSDTTDVVRVEKHLKENAPTSPKDNGLPRFAIVGKDHKFYLGIGGQFLGEAVFDFGDNMSSPILFTPSSMTPSTPGNRSSLGFGWQSSSIYMNFVALPGSKDQVGIFFKGNFTGNNNAFNCFHFYAKWRGLTAGYTNSLFTDGAAEPMTIDFEGPNGYPFITLFTAYWQQNFTDNLSGAIGIDAPSASMTTNATTSQVNQRMPAVPFYLQYAWNEGNSHVRLSSIVRPLQYRDKANDKNSTMVGAGVQLSGMTEIAGPLSLSYNLAYGKGIGTYLQDDNGLGLDAVATTTPGKMDLVKSMGVTAGLNYAISPKVSANLVYSHLSNWLPGKATISDETYRYGDYVAANVIYNINSYLSAGIEYDYGHSKNFEGQGLHSNRLQMQLAVTF